MKRRILGSLTALVVVAGCVAATAEGPAPGDEALAALTDAAWLGHDLWNDGQAEIAFYRVERSENQYGRAADQQFLAGTYLVKHDFDVERMAKADAGGVPAFKWALFYAFESGSYEYKRHWVVNAARATLAPLKASFSMFDWCSNVYRELAFDGRQVERRLRSDDYGNAFETYPAAPGTVAGPSLPLFVRALDFSDAESHRFDALFLDGTRAEVVARHAGTERVETPAGAFEAEKITLTYRAEAPSPVGERADRTETYWRGTGPARLLLKMEAASGRYRMTLVEHLRSPYWQENFWPRLERVETRP